MEPAFQRGDILLLTNHDDPIRSGEIVVFKIKDRDIPIVHRVMKVHEKADGKVTLPLQCLDHLPACNPAPACLCPVSARS